MFFLILALVCFGLIGLLWAGTVWFQGYIYESVTASDLYWRVPAASVVLTLFLGLWCFIAYRNPPESVPGMFQFQFSQTNLDKPFDKFLVEKADHTETQFNKRTILKGSISEREYRDAVMDKWPLQPKPEAIIIFEDKQRVRFEARHSPGSKSIYVDERGRVISEEDPGVYSLFSGKLLLLNLGLYLGLLVVWFACLWLLLRFQWSHAFGIALLFWLMSVLILVTMLVGHVQGKGVPEPAAATAP